ncbi:MAG: hypothetical protein DME25_01640 [Verrucomicrobia bacterium]|nr:MAG: hypothetical protein DME25_01640 [Verrucomicrobiota bacterium]
MPALPTSPRTAPDGLPYDYDDGYVHTDISGNFGGQTWNWGYDDSSRQVVGNTIEMSRSVPVGNIPASTVDFGFSDGAEIAYNRRLGAIGEGRFGLEIAANYLGLGRGDDTSFAGQVGRTTDAYPFTPGTTPPAATPTNVYQGTFNGPGFVINTTFTRRNDVVSTAIITGRRRFDADVWGFRLGPYLEVPLDERLQLSLSAGLAVAVINAEASWRETVSLAGHGSASLAGAGRDEGVRFGGYVGGNLLWRLNEHWNAVAGVQYQNLGTYQHAFGGREVELDLRHSIFVMVGVGYGF